MRSTIPATLSLIRVASSADTVVLLAGPSPAILEKPQNETDQMDMLRSYRGEQVQVVTGVTIGALSVSLARSLSLSIRVRLRYSLGDSEFPVQPIIANPGYSVSSLVVGTKVRFSVPSRAATDSRLTLSSLSTDSIRQLFRRVAAGLRRLRRRHRPSWGIRDSGARWPLGSIYRRRLQQRGRLPGTGVLCMVVGTCRPGRAPDDGLGNLGSQTACCCTRSRSLYEKRT